MRDGIGDAEFFLEIASGQILLPRIVRRGGDRDLTVVCRRVGGCRLARLNLLAPRKNQDTKKQEQRCKRLGIIVSHGWACTPLNKRSRLNRRGDKQSKRNEEQTQLREQTQTKNWMNSECQVRRIVERSFASQPGNQH